MTPAPDLETRLRPFVTAGLLTRIPTPAQLRQAELEMTPYVISTDATLESAYRRPFGHPLLRQPLVASQVGIDHFRTGSALGARLPSLIAHLQLTYHQGMPVFDLQAVQTHPAGLDQLRGAMIDIRAPRTALARRRRRIADLIFRDPDGYFDRFLGGDGWIARAARFDYDSAAAAASSFPPEFFSLVGLLEYSARTFPDRPPRRAPGRLLALASRRFREGRGFGWFRARSRQSGPLPR
ncbi:MAG TPA: hypothetical protein VL172_11860 [Kofleriaceae bacterium]|nr:hypothetical protein [Kofleriaceae bacterium]